MTGSTTSRGRFLCAAFLALAAWPQGARAQECRPQQVDSAFVWSLMDSVAQGRPRSRQANIEFHQVPIASSAGCWTAIAISWGEGLGGALAILKPGGELSNLFDYPGLRNVRSAGDHRLALSYRVGYATGWALATSTERFVVLCKLAEWHWAECFDAEELFEEEAAPEAMASDSSVGLYTRRSARIALRGNTVRIHRRFEWMVIYADRTLGKAHAIDLGTSDLRLP